MKMKCNGSRTHHHHYRCLNAQKVGLGCITSIINQYICGTLAMVDLNTTKLQGEAKDFLQGGGFHQTTKILASDQYDVSEHSDLIIITAGVPQKPGESRLSLVERNADIMKKIMPEVLKYSPNGTILIASNPCDIMTAIAAKIAGPDFPQGKIFGAGTCLDSSRFRMLIANSMDLVSLMTISGRERNLICFSGCCSIYILHTSLLSLSLSWMFL